MARKYKNYKSFNSSYIGGWTFEDGDKVLTIKDVQPMMVRNEKNQSGEEKMCILFEETDKPMVLNSTNNDTITKVLGSSLFDNWIGKQILIGTEKVRAFGDIWDAVRVRPELPKPKTTDPITPEQIDAINGLIETGAITNANMMLKYYKVSRLEEMSRAEAEQLIRQKSAGV
jgi:hypothetical protein